MSSGAFQPMARTAKLSMPSLIFGVAALALAASSGRAARAVVAVARPVTKERRFMGRSEASQGIFGPQIHPIDSNVP
jgi:hypothetical protein